jgi:hypothetical protein
MYNLTNHPLLLFVVSFLALWFWAGVGWLFLRKRLSLEDEIREDFGFILGASLTLLGLIIGFSFSMATSRYDQRKNYEEAEANAIGTEYLRASLLPSADGARVRGLLKQYLEQRIQFYLARDEQEERQIDESTSRLQTDLWSAVLAATMAHPTSLDGLAVSGMNDVLNSQGYTQAAWWNRIPTASWCLMGAIAVCCNLLVGYGLRGAKSGAKLLPVLPLVLAIAFMLIADIETPRYGIIRVKPQNLMSLSQSLQSLSAGSLREKFAMFVTDRSSRLSAGPGSSTRVEG